MRALLFTVVLAAATWVPALGQEASLTNIVQASLVFRDETNSSAASSRLLTVYLRLENHADSDVIWVCNPIEIKAELLDSNGHRVNPAPAIVRIMSAYHPYRLPSHSQLNWAISQDPSKMFIFFEGDAKDKSVLMVGSKVWLVPTESLPTYSLSVYVTGLPQVGSEVLDERRLVEKMQHKLLFEAPPTHIAIR